MYNLENNVAWTSELKQAFKENVTRGKIVYNQEEYTESDFLKKIELKDYRYVPDAGFIGQAVARMATIILINNEESNINFENADFELKIGAEYNNNTYYINYGNFIVNEAPENDDTNGTVKFTAYDYMIKFNKPYVDTITYPCTLLQLTQNICTQAGVQLATQNFANYNFQVENNQFEGKTLREVLQHIAKCAFSWARIGQDNQLYLDFVVNNTITETITNSDYKMDAFKKANEYYGAINKVTYADTNIEGQEESVQDDADIALHGVKELIIYDNYFAYTTAKRQQLIQAGIRLFGFKYMPIQQLDLIGLAYLDCNDILGIQDGNSNTYLTRNFSHVIEYNGALFDKIQAEGKSENEETYINKNNSTVQNSRTEIILDRANKELELLASDKVGANEIIAKINLAIEDEQGVINITGNQVTIESDNFQLDADGGVVASDILINNGSLLLEDNGMDAEISLVQIHSEFGSEEEETPDLEERTMSLYSDGIEFSAPGDGLVGSLGLVTIGVQPGVSNMVMIGALGAIHLNIDLNGPLLEVTDSSGNQSTQIKSNEIKATKYTASNSSGIYLDQYGNIVTQEIHTGGNWHIQNGNTRPLQIDWSNSKATFAGDITTSSGNVEVGSGNSICRLNGSNGNATIGNNLYVDNGHIRSAFTYTNDTVTNAPNMYITSGGNIRRTTNTSSERYKKDIKNIKDEELNPKKLYNLPIRQFKYKTTYLNTQNDARYDKELIGLIAEEVEKYYPVAVDYEFDENGNKYVENWNEKYMIPAMLKLIQEQHDDIEQLKDRMHKLEILYK